MGKAVKSKMQELGADAEQWIQDAGCKPHYFLLSLLFSIV